jgi:hypothetical protein
MADDDLSRLLEKHSTLELARSEHQFFATVDRDEKVQMTVLPFSNKFKAFPPNSLRIETGNFAD